jgi:hypothetical protein
MAAREEEVLNNNPQKSSKGKTGDYRIIAPPPGSPWVPSQLAGIL